MVPNFSIVRFIKEGVISDPGAGITRFLCESLSNAQIPIPPCSRNTFIANSLLCETLVDYLSAADKLLWHPDIITRGILTGDTGVILLLRVLSFITPHAAALDEQYLLTRDESVTDLVIQTGHALTLCLAFRRSMDFARLQLDTLSASTITVPSLLPMLVEILDRCTLFVGRSLYDLKVSI